MIAHWAAATLAAAAIGFFLDLIMGDPEWMPHPVRMMGAAVSGLEKRVRPRFPADEKGTFRSGVLTVLLLLAAAFALSWGLLRLLEWISPWARIAGEGFLLGQLLSTRSLRNESEKVRVCLERGDTEAARTAVSRIVGRDTERLDREGIVKAAVETVAENTADGTVAPLFFFTLGGLPLAMVCKAVNTLDSMIGYKNEAYLFFGRFAAKTDDAVNYLPARIAAALMTAAAFAAGYDGKKAWKIFRRDGRNHASPNSGQTEAACAGALGIRLGGDAWYFGRRFEKKTIGDAERPAEPEDIRRAGRLLYITAFLAFFLSAGTLTGLMLFARAFGF